MAKLIRKREAQAAKAVQVNEAKWSKPLMDSGWTAIPSVIIERQKALGLDYIDVNILLHLATYWWTEGNKPHPAKKTIAEAMQIHPRTVQRRIAEMEKGGLIKREERRLPGKGSNTNLYHFDGLIKAAKPYAQEKIEQREQRQAEEQARRARKGKPRLRLVENTDEK